MTGRISHTLLTRPHRSLIFTLSFIPFDGDQGLALFSHLSLGWTSLPGTKSSALMPVGPAVKLGQAV